MNSKKTDFGSKDLISNLPDPLIGHILSFLSTKDAALNSVLSKRWRFLLGFVPNLEFDTSLYYHSRTGEPKRKLIRRSFKVFVDRVMALQGNASINKFTLKCRFRDNSVPIDGWISNMLERGVLDLDLYICAGYEYRLPSKVLMSKTLVRLKAGGTREFTIDVGEVSLPKLKTLYLLDYVVYGDVSGAAFSKLISGCHALEELIMINTMWGLMDSCSVSNQTLKRVTICSDIINENPESVSFDTPNVVYLEFTETVAFKYPKVNFDSLVEASLGLRMTPIQINKVRDSLNAGYSYPSNMVGDASDFLLGISNV